MTVHNLTQHAAPSQPRMTKAEQQLRIFEAMVEAYKAAPQAKSFDHFLLDMQAMINKAHDLTDRVSFDR